MRLRCACGRNLADVTVAPYNVDWVPPVNHYARRAWRRDDVYLMVTPRIKRSPTGPREVGVSVYQREHHMRPGPTMERTYTWQCWCGQNWQRTAKKVALAWDALISATTPSPSAGYTRKAKVVVAVLDVDL